MRSSGGAGGDSCCRQETSPNRDPDRIIPRITGVSLFIQVGLVEQSKLVINLTAMNLFVDVLIRIIFKFENG